MRCPYCGSTNTQVKDSRPSEDHTTIRRRRVCADCGGRFTTFERVQLRDDTARLRAQLSSTAASARVSSRAKTELGLVEADSSTTAYVRLPGS